MNNSLIYQLSLEANGLSFESTQIEYEIEIYLEDLNLETLASQVAYTEEQEQWGIHIGETDDNAASGSVRVRRSMSDEEGEKFVLTIKSKSEKDSEVGQVESEMEVDRAMFDQMSKLADQGLIKTRYHIPYTSPNGHDLTIEIDIFKNKDNVVVPWAKLDIELPEGVTYKETGITKESLPMDFKDFIMITPEMKESGNETTLKKVEALYDKYFKSKNKHK